MFLCSLSIGINMHFIDIFLNWYHIGFDCTPYWNHFCFRQKGGEYFVLFSLTPLLIFCFEQKGGEEFVFTGFVFTLTPLQMIDKNGEKYLVYMHVLEKGFMCLHICFVFCKQEKKDLMCFMLVYACLSPCICIHVYVLYCHIYCLFPMHELRGSFFEA